jgi:hypothetical protein
MIDPMANLDAPAATAENADEKDVIDMNTLRYNLQNIDQIRSVMGIASGCVAGICGLTGWEGLGVSLCSCCMAYVFWVSLTVSLSKTVWWVYNR